MRVQSLGQEDAPGERNGKPLRYSCLENPRDKGAWKATFSSTFNRSGRVLGTNSLPTDSNSWDMAQVPEG